MIWGICAAVVMLSHSAAASGDGVSSLGPVTMLHSRLEHSLSLCGPATLQDVHVPSLKLIGPLDFKDLKVIDHAHIIGPIKGERAHFKTLKVIGELNVHELTCHALNVTGVVSCDGLHAQKADVTGSLHLTRSQIDVLHVTSNQTTLDATKIRSIIVHKDQDKQQQLTLKGATVVQDIEFESGQGVVHVISPARISGTVQGAVVH